jgi:hypothetical protein
MYPIYKLTKDENGSVIVVALLLLVFLTIIGITATSNSRMESNVTLNSQIYKRDFYVADSGWRTAAMDIDFPELRYPTLLKVEAAPIDGVDNDGDGTVDEAGERYLPLGNTAFMQRAVYDYTATQLDPERTVGSSGAMYCRDVPFEVTSWAETDDNSDGNWTQTQRITTRLIKTCCTGY